MSINLPAADFRRYANDRVEHAIETEVAEKSFHWYAVEWEPNLGYAQVKQTADNVAAFEAFETAAVAFDIIVDGTRTARKPKSTTVETVWVAVIAHTDRFEAVGSIWRGVILRSCPAYAAMWRARFRIRCIV